MIKPEEMQVVVLMGGLGTRLTEYTRECPKSMVDVCGKPFFDYQLKLMAAAGFRKFLFLVGYLADVIEEYYGDGKAFGVSITYRYDGERLLGTGGAVRRAFDLLEEDFLVIYGDSFMDIDYEEAIYRYESGRRQGKSSLMALMENRDRYDKSNALVCDGELILYDKHHVTPDMEYIDYGVCIYRKELFAPFEEGKPFDLAVIQTEESKAGRMAAQIVTTRFYEIGSPSALEEFREYARHRFYTPRPAVFLDRDGVINEIVFNEDTEQLDSPLTEEEFRLLPGVEEALYRISRKGYYIFVVTNQPAAAKGKVRLSALYDINRSFLERMESLGIRIDGVFMCPHYPKAAGRTKDEFLIGECSCRKPKPGLLYKAGTKYSLDWENSWMAGDSFTDIQAGRAAGVRTAFLGNYKCDVCRRLEYDKPDLICGDLCEFSNFLEEAN